MNLRPCRIRMVNDGDDHFDKMDEYHRDGRYYYRDDVDQEIKHLIELQRGAVALAARLADMTADRDMARRSLEELQQRWTENRPAAEYKARLAEAERTRANELAYVAEACIVATSQRDSHEARSHILDLRAWARSRASVPPYGAEIAASSAPAAQEGGK